MTTLDIVALVETLRACGVTHYKNGDLELDLGSLPPKVDTEEQKAISEEAKKYAAEFLDDNALLDKLFPCGADGGLEELAHDA